MVEMGKECGIPSNFDMTRPFTSRKKELPRKTEVQPIKIADGLLYPRVEKEQRTHSGDEIGKRWRRGEGEVAFFSAKHWDRKNRADLIESATPCHDAQVVGPYHITSHHIISHHITSVI